MRICEAIGVWMYSIMLDINLFKPAIDAARMSDSGNRASFLRAQDGFHPFMTDGLGISCVSFRDAGVYLCYNTGWMRIPRVHTCRHLRKAGGDAS